MLQQLFDLERALLLNYRCPREACTCARWPPQVRDFLTVNLMRLVWKSMFAILSRSGRETLALSSLNNDVDTVLLFLEYGADLGDSEGLEDVLSRPSIDEAIVQTLEIHLKVTEQERSAKKSEDSSSNEN